MEYIPSSIPFYKEFGNPQYSDTPYIDITLSDTFGDNNEEYIKVKASDSSNYTLTITGTKGGGVSTTSFNINNDGNNNPILSLCEAMKKSISLFYGVKTYTDEDGNTHVKAYYDTSTNYLTTISSGLSVSGDYNGKYIPLTKFTMHYNVNDGDAEFDTEKYTNDKTVRFNLPAPFTMGITKYPIKFTYGVYYSYDTADGETNTRTMGEYDGYIVLPTTIGDFTQISYGDRYVIGTLSNKHFLTTNEKRTIGYGERIGLSVLTPMSNNLTDDSELRFRVLYFTPSGILITSKIDYEYNPTQYKSETVNGRRDIYIDPDIAEIEGEYGKAVGYIECVMMNDATEVTERIRLNVNGRCSSLNTVYFINKIGGVDWYTFRGSNEREIGIDSNETYTSIYDNEMLNAHNTHHKTNVRYKTMEKTKTLNTGRISHSEAIWLDELASSRYCFIYNDDTESFYEIVVDDVSIDIDSSENYAEASISYYMGDKDIL